MISINIRKGLLGILLGAFALLALGMASYAHAADLTWNADQAVTLSSFSSADFTIVSGSKATSLIVNTGDVQVVVASGDTFTFRSPNSQLSVSGATTATASASCGDGGVSTATVTGGSGGETITIAGSADRCSFGGSGSSGGGSSNSSSDDAEEASDEDEAVEEEDEEASDDEDGTPSPALASQYASLLAQLKSIVSQLVARGVPISAEVQAMVGITDVAPGTFTRDLEVGSTGADVRALQVYLNTHGATLAQSGPGSPGNETTVFGGLTRAALAKFQSLNGISPAAGYFGPKTRAYIAAP